MSDAYEQGYQYVLSELRQGVALDEIRRQLVASGWTPQDVASVIQRAHDGAGREYGSGSSTLHSNRPGASMPSSAMPGASMPDAGMSGHAISGNSGSGSSKSEIDASPRPTNPYNMDGSTYSYSPPNSGRRLNFKAAALLIGGTLCFLLAFGLIMMMILNGGGRAIRVVVFLIIIGGAMIKNGFDAMNKG